MVKLQFEFISYIFYFLVKENIKQYKIGGLIKLNLSLLGACSFIILFCLKRKVGEDKEGELRYFLIFSICIFIIILD